MLSTNHPVVTRVRHELKLRRVTVARVERLSPHFARITFEGPALRDFVSASFDDHVKLMIPPAPGAALDLPVLGPGGPTLAPGAIAPVMRDFTPRAFDGHTLTLELALHGTGPAATWARAAAPGDAAAIGGPRGSMIIPAALPAHLLIGDDTALPAIARRLEELPGHVRATAIIEVEDAADQRALSSPAAAEVHWVTRGAPDALADAVARHATPVPDGFAWAAGEADAMARVRRRLIALGFARDRMRVSAYWKRGAVGHHGDVADEPERRGAVGA